MSYIIGAIVGAAIALSAAYLGACLTLPAEELDR
jgi:hypothetical protein